MRSNRETSLMSSSTNDYSHLKWPLTVASILTTFLAFILMLCFRSDAWFTYELIHNDNRSIISNSTSYPRILEYGSIGLWTICTGASIDPNIQCNIWTRETRPHSFNVIMVLVACALFLTNLTVFPSWGATILIVYNSHNRYLRHILGFIWILLLLTLCFTVLLLIVLLLIALTPFAAPGKFIINTQHLYFYSSQGLFYIRFATFLAVVCLLLVIATLIWKKSIQMELMEAERDLLRQLSDDSYRPGWHRIVMAPRTPVDNDPLGGPPPYQK